MSSLPGDQAEIAPLDALANPVLALPRRRPGSIRRTVTTDVALSDGLRGPVVFHGRARDLLTATDGTATVVAEAESVMELDNATKPRIQRMRTVPAVDLPAVGASATHGFRDLVAAHVQEGSLLAAVLDDVPAAVIISTAGLPDGLEMERDVPLDVCAGWATGGTLARIVLTTGRRPHIPRAVAPPIADPRDPLAVHELPPIGPGHVRRLRYFDVVLDERRTSARIVGGFRDIAVQPGAPATVVHEYELELVVDAADGLIRAVAATPNVLPGPECPDAVASAQHVVGLRLASLRSVVARDFRGLSTCTHLNDQLRFSGDAGGLLGGLADA